MLVLVPWLVSVGQTYYVHEETGETRWTKPVPGEVKFMARKAVVAGGVGAQGGAEVAETLKARMREKAAANLNLPRIETAKSNIRKRKARGLSRGFSKQALLEDGEYGGEYDGAMQVSRATSATGSKHFGGRPSMTNTSVASSYRAGYDDSGPDSD